MKRFRMVLLILCMSLLTSCSEYTDEEKDKVADLVKSESGNFKDVAREQYGDVKVTDIEGESHLHVTTNVLPSSSVRAGSNLFGTIKPKGEQAFDVMFHVESQEIYSHRNYEMINQSMADELAKHDINVLAIERTNSAAIRPMYSEDITSYKQLIDLPGTMNFRIVTDSELGEFDPLHFSSLYDEIIESDENGGFLWISIAQVNSPSEDNANELMDHWLNHGLAFSEHESIYYDGEFRNGDSILSEYGVVATLSLEDSRDGAMTYTNSNDVRTVTYRTPNKAGEYSRVEDLLEER